MLSPPPRERLALPAPAAPTTRPPFPWVATLAPVVVSVALWIFTQSVFSLLFALLGPLVAAGGVADGARSRRRTARTERQRISDEVARVDAGIELAHTRERARLASLLSVPAAPGWAAGMAGAVPVRVGTGDAPSVVELAGDDRVGDGDESPVATLRAHAERIAQAPLLVDAADGIGVVGPAVLAVATARALAVQIAARFSPSEATLAAPEEEGWTFGLPHRVVTHPDSEFRWSRGDAPAVTIAWASRADELPLGCATILEAGSAWHAITALAAADAASVLSGRAEALGHLPGDKGLADSVALADLLDRAGAVQPGLSAVIGIDAAGPVTVDLVVDGPHALVAGTTGSGKSELLVTWVLAMANGRSPDEISFLLIDFKGGAAFAPLAGMPHVLATLSDLDARLTRRAVESLRAELLRRERLLAEASVRAIEQLPPGVLSRLVIVVDEFAAVVSASPELNEVFADLAARGRSLGLHLILCTQRPAGVVRDAVLANIGLRMSLRVTDRSDSIAMVGDDSASRLPAHPRGRAILVEEGRSRTLQIAIAAPADRARVAASGSAAGVARPWCDPLPDNVDLDLLSRTSQGLPFGLADLPAQQSQPTAAHDPERHGHLLVVGAARSGLTTTLATLAESARRREMPVRVLAADPADAWSQLGALVTVPERCLLLIDDLDALLHSTDADYRHGLVELLATVLRDPSPSAPSVVVAARRITGPLAGLTGLFGSRVLLRQATRDDHLLAGGTPSTHDPDRRPGAGEWRGAEIQVARALGGTLPQARVPHPVVLSPASHPVLAVVAARPRALLDQMRATGARVLQLGSDTVPDPQSLHVASAPVPTIVIGDPDAWQADWSLLTTARREWPIVFVGCTPADHRALLRDRELPPLLGSQPGECWLAYDGQTVRARLSFDADRGARRADAHDSVAERPENR